MVSANFLTALVHFEEKPEFDTHDSLAVLYRGLSPWVVLRYAGLPSWSRGLSPGSRCDAWACRRGLSP